MANENTTNTSPTKSKTTRKYLYRILKLLFATYLLIKFLGMHGCYGPFRGVVVDSKTGAPIKGAVVMAKYSRGDNRLLFSSRGKSMFVKECVTDKNGEFLLWPESVFYLPFPGMVSGIHDYINLKPDIFILKPGYHFLSLKQVDEIGRPSMVKSWSKMEFETSKEFWADSVDPAPGDNVNHTRVSAAARKLELSAPFSRKHVGDIPLYREAYTREYDQLVELKEKLKPKPGR